MITATDDDFDIWREPLIMLTTPAGADPYFAAAPSTTARARNSQSTPQTTAATSQTAPAASRAASEPSATRTEMSSYSAQYTEMARLAVNATLSGDSESDSEQLHFSFFAEAQRTFMASLQERIESMAAGRGAQGNRLLAAANRVQVRFQISGSIMTDFTRASEKAGQGSDDLFGQFMDSMDAILATPDDEAGVLLQLLEKMFGEEGDLGKALRNFLSNWQNAQSGKQGGTGIQSMQLEFEFEYVSAVEEQQVVQSADPIVLDLDGNGVSLTSHENGADFDITGSGGASRTAFVNGGDAFLAWDRNGNGSIDNGRELFGDQWGANNGFEELAKLDDNGDGVISAADKAWGQLLLFKDNGNGRSERGELMGLADAGISELRLNYVHVSMQASGGNRISQISTYRRADGSYGNMADAMLNYTA
jgi:hypothetical protein